MVQMRRGTCRASIKPGMQVDFLWFREEIRIKTRGAMGHAGSLSACIPRPPGVPTALRHAPRGTKHQGTNPTGGEAFHHEPHARGCAIPWGQFKIAQHFNPATFLTHCKPQQLSTPTHAQHIHRSNHNILTHHKHKANQDITHTTQTAHARTRARTNTHTHTPCSPQCSHRFDITHA